MRVLEQRRICPRVLIGGLRCSKDRTDKTDGQITNCCDEVGAQDDGIFGQ